jgi:hypothetical protein
VTAMSVDAETFLGPQPVVLSVKREPFVLDRTECHLSDGMDEGDTKDPHRIAG